MSGENQVAKLIEINERHFDLRAEGDLLLVAYADRPGVMGTVGALLGDADVNILAAQISQEISGHASIMVLRVDRLPGSGIARDDRCGRVGQRHPGYRRRLRHRAAGSCRACRRQWDSGLTDTQPLLLGTAQMGRSVIFGACDSWPGVRC